MGIPYYFHTLYKKYANAKLMMSEGKIAEQNVSHLFLDYNSMIHPCAQQVLATLRKGGECLDTEVIEAAIIENTITYTRYIQGLLRPKNMYIMIDGVAPRAKINQQRERRYKSYFLKTLSASDDVIYWDSNKITPGTGFMSKLRKALDLFKKECDELHFSTTLYISDSNECGEGEHKMMKYISDNLKTSNDKLMIYGLDADLIMLSLLNVARDNIILIRDNTFNEKLKESERTFSYLDIQQLGDAVYKELIIGLHKEQKCVVKDRLINDYIFLCFMLGNDFVDHLPSLLIKENGVNILTKYYINSLCKNIGEATYLLDNGKPLGERLNLHMYMDIMGQLSSCEDYFFKKVYSAYKGNGIVYKDIPIDQDTNKVQLHFLKQDVIRYNDDGYKQRYYKYYGISEVEEVCKDYIEGLYWISGYYNNHEHSNWSWYYKHHATPFVSDVYNYLRKNTKNIRGFIAETKSLQSSSPISTLEQLCMVLPRDSLTDILENTAEESKRVSKIKRIFRTNSDILERYYPTRITLDLIHKEWLWQSKVFFDNFNKDILDLIL